MSLGSWTLAAAVTVKGLVVVGALLVVGKAVIAYRQHDSRPMLFLAIGLFLLLVVPPVFETIGEALLDGRAGIDPVGGDPPSVGTIGTFMLVEQLIRLSGLAALLASIYSTG